MMLGIAKASRRGTSEEFGTTLFFYNGPYRCSDGQENNYSMKKKIDCIVGTAALWLGKIPRQ